MDFYGTLDRTKVMVMSEDTWNGVRSIMLEVAPKTDDPIGYLARYSGIPVYIDNELPLNAVEVYEKWLYDAIQDLKQEDKEGEL